MALIYIVEDDQNIREIESFALKNSGYTIMDFECAKDFYHQLAEKVPDCILLDIMLPDEDGLEILKKIRSIPDTRKVPIMMITAKTTELDKVKGLDLGADDYITKPFSATYLQARVENLLMQRKKLQNFYRDSLTHVTVSEIPVAQGETLAGHASAEPVSSAAEEPAMPEMSPNDRKFMDKLVDLMEQNMDNGELVVDDLVRELAVSRSVFFKKLKTLTGLAPIEFIKEMRIKRAAQLIETGEFNMTQISYMVGINDPRYFSKCFKAQVGMTPTEYREKVGR